MTSSIDRLGCEIREEVVSVPGGRVERVTEPANVEALCGVVRAAGEDRLGLLLMGGRSRLDYANEAGPLSLGVSTSKLSGVDEFEPDEGVLHAGAGTPIRTLRDVVAPERWELPLEAPSEDATLGGTIASAMTGPRALAFGAVKDAILGLEVVGGDGSASKCGGRVVKNVTGYDLAKLHCGAFGSFGVVTGAWLRLRPSPSRCAAFTARCGNGLELFEAVRKRASRPALRALIWQESGDLNSEARVRVEFGGSDESVEADRAAFAEVLALEPAPLTTLDEAQPPRAAPVVLRARVLGSRVGAFVRSVRDAGLALSSDVGLGVVHAWGPPTSIEVLLGLRERAIRLGGFATFLRLPAEWRNGVDVFGDPDAPDPIVTALSNRFDPQGILNPGRFIARERGTHAK